MLKASGHSQTRTADTVHSVIVKRIVTGAVRPGDMLSEKALAEDFNTSRTPVREALHRLSAEGLAERGPRRAFIVKRMDVEALQALFEAVGDLEALMAGKAALRMTEIERQMLAAIVQEGEDHADDPDAYAAINTQFHAAISAGGHNSILSATLAELNLRTLPWRGAQFSNRSMRIASSRAEHRAIYEAIAARDAAAAENAMRTHVAASLMVISEVLAEEKLSD
ncbi:GntR family transcriptional regulator [Rhizobiaceae bacterium BDR2-2]|uniref:GntR family transcriptional regulator n=1 Tax=Ectorhizobium quercum TaxID=2965071 RepID=A0AAE3N318_9HYPH|nr:GntR family transcriptional regulator [Ectorhizobium quercum]MCX8999281.1 GntR family transcriptional regulator [Ectorhizobium quercum]